MDNYLFEKAPVPRTYMKLALPVVFSMIVTLIYNMVDTYFIARTGNTDLVAGVSLAAPIFTLMIAFGDIWGLGGSSLISRLFGQKKDDEAKRVSSFCFWSAIIFGLCVTLVLLIFRGPVLHILGAGSSTLAYSSAYYTWIAIGAAFIILGLVPTNLMRTEGMAAEAMFGSILGSVVNIILDPIFIFTLHQGAAGAAIATVIGNICADIYYVCVILKKSRRLSIAPSLMRIPAEQIRSVLAIGFPASITNLMQSLMIMITNHFLLAYGTDKIAALGIALKANMITMLILVAFAFGGQPLIGYNYGARNKDRLKEILKFAYIFEAVLALVFTIVMSILAPQIIRIFMNDASVVTAGSLMLRLLQLGMVFMSVVLVSTCVCQSVGNGSGALLLSVSRQGLVYAIVIFLLSHIFGYHGVLVSQACADLVTAIMSVFIIRKLHVLE